MTTRFDPQGKAHWVLSQLEDGPRSVAEIEAIARSVFQPNHARKIVYVIAALCVTKCAKRKEGTIAATPLGFDVLAILDNGSPYDAGFTVNIGTRRGKAAA